MSEEKIHIARLRKQGKIFEIDIDPEKVLEFKQGKADVREVLKAEQVFSDAKKGMLASEKDMEKIFDTSDPLEVAKIILREGEIPLTASQKRAILDEKKKKIASIIHMNAVDPKTHIPHPQQRIEAAMDEAKFRIDERKSAEEQVEDALKAIRAILPIKFERKEIAVKIPPSYAPQSYPILKSFGTVIKEEWLNDGSLAVLIKIPGGLEEDFYQKLNALCHGEVETKLLKTE